jgi:hypothetical protein
MSLARRKRISSYSALQQAVAGLLVVSLWSCATVPPAPRAGEPVYTTRTDTAVVGRLVLVRSGTDQTPYRSIADHALCFVPDDFEHAKKGVRAATIETDGTFKALLPPGDYKLYSQHRIDPVGWLAVLPVAKLGVSSRSPVEIQYAGTLRLNLDQAVQAGASKSGKPDVRPVPVAVSDESEQQARNLGASPGQALQLVPGLIQVQSDIAFGEPRQNRAACSTRELYPGEVKEEDKKVAYGVLGVLLLIPIAALALITAPLWIGGRIN